MRTRSRWRRTLLALAAAGTLAAATSCLTGQRPRLEPAAVATGPTTRPPPGSAATAAAPPPSFTVVATGDVLVHTPLAEQAAADARVSGADGFDFRPLLAGIRPVISSADLAICHLETPLAPAGGPYSAYPTFSVPPQIAAALADLGYDTCSTASNHTLDKDAAGVRRTLDGLDAVRVRHAGSARSAAEAATPTILDVHGVKVAHLSYAYGFNGIAVPADTPWIVNRIDTGAILTAARRARAAGAQVVVVSMHWGIEYHHDPTAEQRQIARALLADPAVDLLVGHHAHVTQPFERIGDKWVAYGLGNLVARHDEPRGSTEEGLVARFRFSRDAGGHWRVTRAEYVPTYVDLAGPIRLVDLTAALADPRLPAERRARYERAEHDTDEVVTSLGADRAGLVRAAPAR